MVKRRVIAAALLVATCFAPVSAFADVNAGAYLAARQAAIGSDYDQAAEFYARALSRDPSNRALLDGALSSFLSLGEIGRAAPIATRVIQSSSESQLANLVLMARDVDAGSWDTVIANLDAGQSVGPLFDSLLRAWAHVGQGRMSDALAAFDAVAGTGGVQAFGLYHKALALSSVGDFESAEEIFSSEVGPQIRLTRRGVVTYATVLSQLDRNADALNLLSQAFGTNLDPEVAELRARLEAGETVPLDGPTTAAEGVAEVSFTIAGALNGDASDAYTLLFARLAEFLDPAHFDGVLLVATLLEDLSQYDLAVDSYESIPRDEPNFHVAELGRADALRRSGDMNAAIEVLQGLAQSHPDLSVVHSTLGDFLRRESRYGEANASYNNAVDLFEGDQEAQWVVYFSRGITHEREDRWPQAEADFRKALELRPNQPQVLNYLGYSYVELQTNLDEALAMIQLAVDTQPSSGFIVDSLGWVLYRLGRYEEAVEQMERAVELMPIDPVVNDHLGDVYWAVGRQREAEFQWHRALSFFESDESNTDVEPDRIRRKLEVGLDLVLEEEGAPPLEVANDDG